jgi:hypothetical protein
MSDKINELMATEVMGGTSRRDNGRTIVKIRRVEYDLNDWDGTEFDAFMERFPIYSPTTDMNQAMECWEAVPEIVMDLHRVYRMNQYFCTVRINGKHFETLRYGSAPLAICKAILKAKGIDNV